MRKSNKVGTLIQSTGRIFAVTGRFIAQKSVAAYRKIDPDVPRHLAQIPLLTYTLFTRGHEKIEPGEPDGHPPLIFVHGLGGGRGDFLLMAQYLRLKGRKRHYKIKFEKGQSIHQMAGALARFVREVTKVTKQKKVELVAHSLGGLVARAAVIEHGIHASVKTLITLGSPHRGTHPARYLHSKVIKDLRPESPYLKKLNGKRWPKKVRGFAFWSRSDLFILPPESGVGDGMESVEMTPFTHYSYLIDPLSWKRVAGFLSV